MLEKTNRRCYRMNDPDKLRITLQLGNVAQRAEFVKTLLKELV
jgi:transcription-repair coupling factor (superfamily II helicase)